MMEVLDIETIEITLSRQRKLKATIIMHADLRLCFSHLCYIAKAGFPMTRLVYRSMQVCEFAWRMSSTFSFAKVRSKFRLTRSSSISNLNSASKQCRT